MEPAFPQQARRGGRRPGAGRPAIAGSVSHRKRPAFAPDTPLHVTLRVARHVWSLRAQRCLRPIDEALRALARRDERFRVTHFSVQGNHVHVVVEAHDRNTLSSALRSLTVRLARALNRVMGRKSGPVLARRTHARPLSTRTEARNVVRYVLGNHARHVPGAPVADPFSSAPVFEAWAAIHLPAAQVAYALPGHDPPVVPPRSALLRAALTATAR